jgi:hypothetical protein
MQAARDGDRRAHLGAVVGVQRDLEARQQGGGAADVRLQRRRAHRGRGLGVGLRVRQ